MMASSRQLVLACLWMVSATAVGNAQSTRDVRASMVAEAECPAANGPDADPTYPIRVQGLAAKAAGHVDEARRLMRCAAALNPEDKIALGELVYLDLNAKAEIRASEDIDALRAVGGSTARLEAQQGYIEAKAKNYAAARSAFSRAIPLAEASGDTKLREQVMRAIRVLDGEYPRHILQTSLDGQYLSRFDDGVVDVSLTYLERLGVSSPFQVYAGTRLLRDTASEEGPLPQIFSDNALLFGPGLAFQPRGAHYRLTAEADGAYVFYGSVRGTAALRSDLRAVAGYYRTWRPQDGPFELEANGSFGYYSRYQHDAIAYLQPRALVRVSGDSAVVAKLFVQESLALDYNRQFYNNTLELIPGVEVGLRVLPGISLRGEYVAGFYLLSSAASGNPYGSTYSDFRVRLTFQRNLLSGGGSR